MTTILRITNVNTCNVWSATNEDGTGNLWTTISTYNPSLEEYYLAPYESGGYKIVNAKSGYFAHGDNDGTGNLWLFNTVNDVCQVFNLQPAGTSPPSFRIVNKHSGYFAHADNNGAGNLWLNKEQNDLCQLFMFFSRDDNPTGS